MIRALMTAAAALSVAACGDGANAPPRFNPAPPARISVESGAAISIVFGVLDPNGDAVSVTASGLPSGLSVEPFTDATRYRIAGVHRGPACGGEIASVLRATDSNGAFAEAELIFDVQPTSRCGGGSSAASGAAPRPGSGASGASAPAQGGGSSGSGGSASGAQSAHDMGVRKSIPPSSVETGKDVEFRITAENLGSGAVDSSSGITVTDSLPAQFGPPVTVISAQNWNCSPAGTTLNCAWSGPAVGAGVAFPPIRFSARATSAGAFQNCASIASTRADANASNDQSCVSGQVTPPPCKLGVRVSTSTPNVNVGGPISYVIQIANTGAQQCASARFIAYWAANALIGVGWAEYTPAMLTDAPTMAAAWSLQTIGFPNGAPILGGPPQPTGDLVSQPNLPLSPMSAPRFFQATGVGSATTGAILCVVAVDDIGAYNALRFDLSSAAAFDTKPLILTSKFGNDVWAQSINAALQAKGVTAASCAGINVH